MAIKDILLNGSKYADDMVLSLPDGTTATIGDLRSLETEQKQALFQRSQLLEQAETELAGRIHAANQRGLLNPVDPSDAAVRREAAATFGLDENDPLLGNVAKEFKRLRDEQKVQLETVQTQMKNEVASLRGITAKVTGEYLNDYYANKFNSVTAELPAEVRKDITYEAAIKFAEDNRLMDKAGRFDLTAAIDRLSFPKVKEYEVKKAREEAVSSAEKAAQLARMRPQSSSNSLRTEARDANAFSPTVKDGERTRTKTLDEVLAEAAMDDSLWQSALTGGNGLPN